MHQTRMSVVLFATGFCIRIYFDPRFTWNKPGAVPEQKVKHAL